MSVVAARAGVPVARTAARATRPRGALVLMAASGFAGLAYQVAWTQQCALWLGHETAAVLAVVAAFFGGLAVGAWTLGAAIERSAAPARWYAACELVVGLWGVALALALEPASGALLAAIGPDASPLRQWSVAFAGTFALLLPATAAMGATLPAIERVAATMSGPGARRSIAAFYASNTAGAMTGAVVTAAWSIPTLGLVGTAQLCAALDVACAAIACTWPTGVAAQADGAIGGLGRAARGVAWRLGLTGLLGIGYEVVAVRVLSQVTEGTVYTFAALLAVYLAGTAAGAAAWQRRAPDRPIAREAVVAALVVAVALGATSLWAAGLIRDEARTFAGSGVASAIAVEAALAIAAFALPTIAMGALFAALCEQAHAAGLPFGRAVAINTFGAALAPCVFGVWIAPHWGAKAAVLAIAAGYAGLLAAGRLVAVGAAAFVAIVVAAALAPPLVFVDVPAGGRLVDHREGPMGAVSIVEDADGIARLRIDDRAQEGSNATRFVDARQALLPLALRPAARRALFLGLGTGVTASAAAEDPALDVDAVELLPDVIAASSFFTRGFATGDRLHPIAMDARRYVRTARRTYDLVVADNFHPARAGSGALYTVEHFAAVRARLAPGGLLCQWLPLHQLDLATMRSIVRSFLAVWPDGVAILASNSVDTPVVGLVARAGGLRLDAATVREGIAGLALPRPLAAFGLDDEYAVLGSFVAGPSALARFAAGAPLNTDDRPIVAYLAPWATYAPQTTPADRLGALLAAWSIAPDDVVAASTDAATRARLVAYWAARRRYLDIGRAARPTGDVVAMLAQVREPLLDVLATSPDFRPAYEPLLRMATALAPVDPAGARALLRSLERVAPARPEAGAALRTIDAAATDAR